MDQENDYIAKQLKAYRKSRKYTQKYVADKLSVIRQTYSHYETGRIKPPVDTLIRIASLYQIPFAELVPKEDDSNLSKFDTSSLLYDSSRIGVESELLAYYRPLSQEDKEDILELAKMKYKRLGSV